MSNLFNVQKAKAVLANWDLLQSDSGERQIVKIICPNTGAEYTVCVIQGLCDAIELNPMHHMYETIVDDWRKFENLSEIYSYTYWIGGVSEYHFSQLNLFKNQLRKSALEFFIKNEGKYNV